MGLRTTKVVFTVEEQSLTKIHFMRIPLVNRFCIHFGGPTMCSIYLINKGENNNNTLDVVLGKANVASIRTLQKA